MDKTHHRPLLPSFDKFGRFVARIMLPMALVLVILLVPSYLASNSNQYLSLIHISELDLDALQGDRLELENLHAGLAEAQTRANALEEIVNFGREAAEKQTQTLVNRGAALLARAAADGLSLIHI